LAKTSLQHLFTAAAINLIRLHAFLEEKKAAKTRISRFAALASVDLASQLSSTSRITNGIKLWDEPDCHRH
jgi:hypothetical protein